MSKSVAAINVQVGADIKQMQKNLKKATKTLRQQSRKWGEFGRNMTAAVSIPVAGFIGRSVQLFDKQAQAIAQVNAGLKSTGNVAGFSSNELRKMASGLQELSTYGDEDILKNVTAQMLTFTNVANEQFPRAQKAVLDLSARLGTDLKGAALQVGKALNDPILGITALSRSGIQFSDSQKQLIKDLTKTGQVAKAQTIILGELEAQFGGSAEAAAKAGLGPIRQFNNSLGDMMETIGGALLPTITDFVKQITGLFKRFDNLSDSTKKTIIQVSLFAAAIGPAALLVSKSIALYSTLKSVTVAVAIATKKFTFSFAGLNAAMKANPIGFIIGAIAALATGFAIAYNHSQRFRATLSGIGSLASEFFKIIKEGFVSFSEGFSALKEGNFKEAFQSFSKGMIKTNPLTIGFSEGGRLAKAYSNGYQKKISDEAAKMQNETVKAIQIPITSIATPTTSTSSPIAGSGGNNKESTTDSLRKTIPLISQLDSLQNKLVESTTAATESFKLFHFHLKRVTETSTPLKDIMQGAGNAMINMAQQGAMSFAALGKAALAGAADVARAKIIEGLTALAAKIFGTSGFAGLFLAPIAIAGATGIFNKIIGSVKPPALAKGGLAYGPTTAIVGDNKGVRSNPEVIAPLDKLESIMGRSQANTGDSQLVARIGDREMLFFIERALDRRKRRGVT